MSKMRIKDNDEQMSPEMVELLTKPCKSNTRFHYGKPVIVSKENKAKYVRTETGIYEIEYDLDHIVITKQECPDTELFIKKANTIEELCDELVFEFGHSQFSNHLEVWHLYHEISLKEEVKNALDDGYRADEDEVKTIYGAIWTERGLKYVAKMNEKGELELL